MVTHKYVENPDRVHRFTVISPNAANGIGGYPRRWTTMKGAEARILEILTLPGARSPELVIVEACAICSKKPPKPVDVMLKRAINTVKGK